MCIITTVCIVCADTYLNNKSVTHIAIRYIAAMLIVCDKIFFCICTEPIQTMCLYFVYYQIRQGVDSLD